MRSHPCSLFLCVCVSWAHPVSTDTCLPRAPPLTDPWTTPVSPILPNCSCTPSELPSSPRTMRMPEETSPSSVVVSCLYRGRRRVLAMSVALVSFASPDATRDTPQFAPPSLLLSIHTHRTSLLAAAVPPSSTQALAMPLSPFKGPRAFPRGNQPPPPVYFPFHALCCARLLAGVRQRRRRATSPWTTTLQRLCANVVPTSVFAAFPPDLP